jgi:hypothetical protein
MSFYRFALALSFAVSLVGQAPGSFRCGKERWSIKTGTDQGAAQIDLTTPTQTTLADLTSFTEPNPIPKETRVQGPETTLWTVKAVLKAFKFENNLKSGDWDYHLVIIDEGGTTMIAEIPFPQCVDSGSSFSAGIANSRQEFDAKFTASGAFQDVSVPVVVTGVGMFDFAHGQRGRADNGIEIHPVLDIAFSDAAVLPPLHNGGQPATQLVGNPSFENGSAHPSPWKASTGVIDSSAAEPAHSGRWKAWLGGYGDGKKHTDTLSQAVTIPQSATHATLSFWLHIDTDKTVNNAADILDVRIVDSSGSSTTLETFSNLDVSDYQKRKFDLSDFIGQTVTITLVGTVKGIGQTSFIVDDFIVAVQ